MMREIKFRQRNKNNGQYYYWGIVNGSWFDPINQDNFVNREESEQYIGLKDKNEKEIYEGDILQTLPIKDAIFEVGHGVNGDDNSFGFMLLNRRLNHSYPLELSVRTMVVIGNIYENKELLKEAR